MLALSLGVFALLGGAQAQAATAPRNTVLQPGPSVAWSAPALGQTTLVPVAPPTPIPINALPFTISQPGYYRVTQNLTGAAGQVGIHATVGDVVIDLNGFEITGAGVGSVGIIGRTNTVVFNGRVTAWVSGGVAVESRCLLADLLVEACGAAGILVGGSSIVQSCVTDANAGDGIRATDSLVIYSHSRFNVGNGIVGMGEVLVARDCTVSRNNGLGILVTDQLPADDAFENETILENCRVFQNNAGGVRADKAARVLRCTVRRNGGIGIQTADASLVEDCAVLDNPTGISVARRTRIESCAVSGGESGILLDDDCSLVDSVVSGNSVVGIRGEVAAAIQGCTVSENGIGVELLVSGRVQDCTIHHNTDVGVRVLANGLVLGNDISSNAGGGIAALGRAARIDGNSVVTNGVVGILVQGTDNLIVRNSLDSNTIQMQIHPDNVQGPFLKTTGFVQSENPWANFDLSFPQPFQ